jgi:hypothetical protein
LLLKQNLDVTKDYAFLTVSLDKHAISWAEEEEQNLNQKAYIMATLQQSASGKRRYQISYSFKYRN